MAKIPVGNPLKTLKCFPTQTRQKLSLVENNISSFFITVFKTSLWWLLLCDVSRVQVGIITEAFLLSLFQPWFFSHQCQGKGNFLAFYSQQGHGTWTLYLLWRQPGPHTSTWSLETDWNAHIHMVPGESLDHTHPCGLWRQPGPHISTVSGISTCHRQASAGSTG